MALSKKDIRLEYKVRTVSAFGGDCRVRSLSIPEMFKLTALLKDAEVSKDYSTVHLSVAKWCAVDEQNQPLFSDADMENMPFDFQDDLQNILSCVLEMVNESREKADAKKKSSTITS